MPAASLRACVLNLGCKVNRIECDWIESGLSDAGVLLVDEERADVVVVNTCAVTAEAQAKTRKAVHHAVDLPGKPRVFVTGCSANLFSDELLAIDGRVAYVADKTNLVQDVLARCGACGEAGRSHEGPAGVDGATVTHMGTVLDDADATALPRHGVYRVRRGVKVQDGCDNRCNYCIVWRARGASRSFPVETVLDQTRRALDEGALEIVLSGINLGKFQADDGHGNGWGLEGLLDGVCALGAPMVRLSSIEPTDITDEILESIARNAPVVCRHLHVPLQSGCSATLGRMGRHYDAEGFARMVGRVRAVLPDVSISTDVIVGFPGETDAEFYESLAFIRAMGFSKIHAFRFSARPDTVAAGLPGQVAPAILKERSARLRTLGDELRGRDALARVGSVERVLVEGVGDDGVGRGTTSSYHDVEVARSCGMGGPCTLDVALEAYDPRRGTFLVGFPCAQAKTGHRDVD